MTHAGDDGFSGVGYGFEGPLGSIMVSPERALLVAFSKWGLRKRVTDLARGRCLPLNPDFSL